MVQRGREGLACLGGEATVRSGPDVRFKENDLTLLRKYDYLCSKNGELLNALGYCERVFGILKTTLNNLILDDREFEEELGVMKYGLNCIEELAEDKRKEQFLERQRVIEVATSSRWNDEINTIENGEQKSHTSTSDVEQEHELGASDVERDHDLSDQNNDCASDKDDETQSEHSGVSASSSSHGSNGGLDFLISAIDTERRKHSSESDTMPCSPKRMKMSCSPTSEIREELSPTNSAYSSHGELSGENGSLYNYGSSSQLVKIKVRTLTQQQINKMNKTDRKMPYQCLVCKKRYQSAPGLRYHYNSTNHGVVATTLSKKAAEEEASKQRAKNFARKKAAEKSKRKSKEKVIVKPVERNNRSSLTPSENGPSSLEMAESPTALTQASQGPVDSPAVIAEVGDCSSPVQEPESAHGDGKTEVEPATSHADVPFEAPCALSLKSDPLSADKANMECEDTSEHPTVQPNEEKSLKSALPGIVLKSLEQVYKCAESVRPCGEVAL
eukprot:Nk52_evm74s217 gene=Nk52_evmTU74s217